jgi:hypothetical protein
VPAITTETGGLARTDEPALELAARGIAGVLKHLGMRTDGPAPIATPRWIVRDEVLRAKTTGLFEASVDCGEDVDAHALIGIVTDFHGNRIEEVRSPFEGEVLYVVRTPPISRGEPLAMIGVASATPGDE